MSTVIKVTHSFSVNFVSNILLHKEKRQKLASSSKACLWFTLSHCPDHEQTSPWAEVPVGNTVLVARVVPVASVHTSPSFSLGSSSQADKAFLASVEYDGCLRQRAFWKQQWVERSKDVNKESPQHTRTQGNHLYVKCSLQRSPGTRAKECREPKLAQFLTRVVNICVALQCCPTSSLEN